MREPASTSSTQNKARQAHRLQDQSRAAEPRVCIEGDTGGSRRPRASRRPEQFYCWATAIVQLLEARIFHHAHESAPTRKATPGDPAGPRARCVGSADSPWPEKVGDDSDARAGRAAVPPGPSAVRLGSSRLAPTRRVASP